MSLKARDYNKAQLDSGQISNDQLLYILGVGTRVIQEANGLVVDGYCGPKTRQIIDNIIQARFDKSPDSVPDKRGMKKVYGSFSFEEGERGRIRITGNWVKENIVRLRLHTGKVIRCHKLVAGELLDLYEDACTLSGYTPRSVACYVPRHAMWNPKRNLSIHSWGVAFDIDPRLNGYGKTETRLRRSEKSMLFVKVFEDAGWQWGGRWRTPDDMHFQRVRS